MHRVLRPAAQVSDGLVVESSVLDGDQAIITVRAAAQESACPTCGLPARRVHSHYLRQLRDLPLAGRAVRLVLLARRFRCDTVTCRRQIFTERFGSGVLEPWARRTARMEPSSTSWAWRSAVVRRRTWPSA
jgi:transposase